MLNESQLKKSIAILNDMELNNYLTTRGIRRLTYEINRLGIPRKFEEPKFYKNSIEFEYPVYFGVAGGLLGAVIGILGGCSQLNSQGPFAAVGSAFNGGIKLLIIGAIVGFIIGLIIDLAVAAGKNGQDKQVYYAKLDDYNKAVQSDDARVNREYIQKNNLINQRKILQNRLQAAQSSLNKYYNIMNIDPNYRHLVPIGYMNEFIRLGISTKLTGADGLYYLVRKELRMDQFQASLDDISSKLDEIIDNQHALYSEIVSINNKCEKMVQTTLKVSAGINQKLDNISANTSIAAYNSARMVKEQEFQNYFLTIQASMR